MPAVFGGGRPMVLEAGGGCGDRTAYVRLDPAVGLQQVGGAAHGALGSRGDGVEAQYILVRGGRRWKLQTPLGRHDGQAKRGAGGRVAPMYHALAADVGRAFQGLYETRRGLWGVRKGGISASVMAHAPLTNTRSTEVALGTPPEQEKCVGVLIGKAGRTPGMHPAPRQVAARG